MFSQAFDWQLLWESFEEGRRRISVVVIAVVNVRERISNVSKPTSVNCTRVRPKDSTLWLELWIKLQVASHDNRLLLSDSLPLSVIIRSFKFEATHCDTSFHTWMNIRDFKEVSLLLLSLVPTLNESKEWNFALALALAFTNSKNPTLPLQHDYELPQNLRAWWELSLPQMLTNNLRERKNINFRRGKLTSYKL